VRAAHVLYGEILDGIEAAGYDVFRQRVRIPTRRKATMVAQVLLTRPR
jgi:phytoene synthase